MYKSSKIIYVLSVTSMLPKSNETFKLNNESFHKIVASGLKRVCIKENLEKKSIFSGIQRNPYEKNITYIY